MQVCITLHLKCYRAANGGGHERAPESALGFWNATNDTNGRAVNKNRDGEKERDKNTDKLKNITETNECRQMKGERAHI